MKTRILALMLISAVTGSGAYAQVPNADLYQLTTDARADVRRFYVSNGYELAWTQTDNITQLVSVIRTIDGDGLDPESYALMVLEQLVNEANDDHTRAILDVLLTTSFLQLAHDLYQGRLDPDKLFAGDWDACTQPADYAGLLQNALRENEICETLDFLRPMDNSYEGLKYMLSRFVEIKEKGGFPEVEMGVDIKPGDFDERMPSIRTKLYQLGLMPEGLANEGLIYDSTLIFAVGKFQRLHNLTEDWVIGPRTQQALALGADDYIDIITANLERYRWHQSRLMERSIQINIPSATLMVIDHEKSGLQMKVITGRVDRRTPVLSSVFNLIIVNPTWTVPPTVLKEDVLPAIISDPGYLTRHRMRIINYRGIEVNPDSLQWSAINASKFPYIIREDAGPQNPLGLVKFSFPNDHSVYLHDTNMPSLFANQDRTLSSGCIRIESPMALVRILLEGSGWTEGMVRDEIKKGETKVVLLRNSLPVHVTYFTARVSNDELVIFRDVYQYDRIVLNALRSGQSRL